jgi:hypothetical protein
VTSRKKEFRFAATLLFLLFSNSKVLADSIPNGSRRVTSDISIETSTSYPDYCFYLLGDELEKTIVEPGRPHLVSCGSAKRLVILFAVRRTELQKQGTERVERWLKSGGGTRYGVVSFGAWGFGSAVQRGGFRSHVVSRYQIVGIDENEEFGLRIARVYPRSDDWLADLVRVLTGSALSLTIIAGGIWVGRRLSKQRREIASSNAVTFSGPLSGG